MNSEDKELFRNGDASFFATTYKKNHEVMIRYAYQILKDSEAADEIVDDVFMSLWENHEVMVVPDNLSSYLFGMVRKRCFSELKAAKHRYETRFENIGTDQAADFLEIVFQDDNNPMEGMLEKEFYDYFEEAVSHLPEQTRKIWVMSKYNKLKYEEISMQLNITVNTVKYHIKQANRLLRDDLARYILSLLLLLQFSWLSPHKASATTAFAPISATDNVEELFFLHNFGLYDYPNPSLSRTIEYN